MVPSRDEAQRLRRLLPNCRARYFNENGHALLLVRENMVDNTMIPIKFLIGKM